MRAGPGGWMCAWLVRLTVNSCRDCREDIYLWAVEIDVCVDAVVVCVVCYGF